MKSLMYPQNVESNSTFIKRMTLCLDPIINSNYGCFSDTNRNKVSCTFNVLPSVLSCVYFGNSNTNYCIPQDIDLSCKGQCGFTQLEVQKLYGCVNTFGKAAEGCDVSNPNFCDCSVSDKTWDGNLNACKCNEDENDYGACCSPLICDPKNNEQFSCDTKACECLPNYHRVPDVGSEYGNKCVPFCAVGSAQNNPIDSKDRQIPSGCGAPNNTMDDLCCDPNSNQCVIDYGTWDKTINPTQSTKATCISDYGIWRITDYNKCPRTGHCDFPSCTTPQLLIEYDQPGGPMWGLTCESCPAPSHGPSPPQCKTPCETHCETQTTYPLYNKYDTSNCGSENMCLCHCKKE
jgi:hypothetical protein